MQPSTSKQFILWDLRVLFAPQLDKVFCNSRFVDFPDRSDRYHFAVVAWWLGGLGGMVFAVGVGRVYRASSTAHRDRTAMLGSECWVEADGWNGMGGWPWLS